MFGEVDCTVVTLLGLVYICTESWVFYLGDFNIVVFEFLCFEDFFLYLNSQFLPNYTCFSREFFSSESVMAFYSCTQNQRFIHS
jgi:hypothetical protein